MHSHLAADPTRFVFVLQPEFPISAAILASEALRIANQNSGQEHFAWQFVSETGEQVRASNGMRLRADADFEGAWRADVCLLFEGNLPTQHVSRKLLAYLRNASRFGAVVGGVDTGAFALSQAGLVTKGSGSGIQREISIRNRAQQDFSVRRPCRVFGGRNGDSRPDSRTYRTLPRRAHGQ